MCGSFVQTTGQAGRVPNNTGSTRSRTFREALATNAAAAPIWHPAAPHSKGSESVQTVTVMGAAGHVSQRPAPETLIPPDPRGRRSRAIIGVIEKFSGLGPRQVHVIASSAAPDRARDILEPDGCDFTNFRRNPVCLFQHDSNEPVARALDIRVVDKRIECLIAFPSPGVNPKSDEVFGLIQARVLNAVSVGFLPKASEPLPSGGRRITRWELLEISFVSLPCNADALIVGRAVSVEQLKAKGRALLIATRIRIEDD